MAQKPIILIVEDESIVALNIQTRLEQIGYEVAAVVSSGEEAIEIVEASQPDLILMDIKLSGNLNGIQAAQQIRARFKIPVVYLTASTDQLTLQQAQITEPYGYIKKPFEPRELYSAIEIALYKHKMDQQIKKREQWLVTILSSIGHGVITTDQDGLITFMNPVAESLTAWNSEDVLGRELSQVFRIIDQGTREAIDNPIAIALREGITIALGNKVLLITRDGREIQIDDRIAPIKGEGEEVRGAVLVFHDIIEPKQAEEAILRANEELQQIVQEVTTEGLQANQQLEREIEGEN